GYLTGVARPLLVLHHRHARDDPEITNSTHLPQQLVVKTLREVGVLFPRAQTGERQNSDRGRAGSGVGPCTGKATGAAAQDEVVEETGSRCEHANAHEHQPQLNPSWTGGGRGPLDSTAPDIEDPSESDDDREPSSQTSNNIREHYVGPVGAMHN